MSNKKQTFISKNQLVIKSYECLNNFIMYTFSKFVFKFVWQYIINDRLIIIIINENNIVTK